MNLIMVSVSALLVMVSYEAWQLICERDLRREILEIRDELRWLAINDATLRASNIFCEFDVMLQHCSGSLGGFSFWTMLPAALTIGKDDAVEQEYRAFVRELQEAPGVESLYARWADVISRHLKVRHWFLFTVVSIVRPASRLTERMLAAAFAQGATANQGAHASRNSVPA